jgi:predicted ester cyclase
MGEAGGGWVAIQWVTRGTNTGPGLDGRPPTGRTLTLRGATFLQVEGDKIRSERVYHDLQTMAKQLG